MRTHRDHVEQMVDYETILMLIAIGPRPDGTYNRCREACQKMAADVLKKWSGK